MVSRNGRLMKGAFIWIDRGTLQMRQDGHDSLYGNYPGHHSMSGIRGESSGNWRV